MNRKKVLLTALSVLCVVLAVMLIAAALIICREGLILKAADPLSRIYSREKAAAALRPALPLLALGFVLTAVGLALGIRDENAFKPVKDPQRLPQKQPAREKQKSAAGQKVRAARLALLALAMLFIVLGVLNGSAGDVFGKAVRICTECIGLG